MRFTVRPGEGVGAIRFGMSREDVHGRLGQPDQEGGWPDTGEGEDEWETDGVAVVFDAAGACVEIALFPPASASIAGVHLLGEADGDARAALRRLAADCGEEEGVVVSIDLGLVYVEDDDGDPELLVVAPGRLDALAADGDEDDEDDVDGAPDA
jgi:hypothetical protein